MSSALSSIGQIAITVQDVPRAAAFYGDVLGLKHLFDAGSMSFFDCGGVRLMLTKPEGSSAGNSILYYKTADIQAAVAAIKSHGVTFEAEPRMVAKMPDHELWMAFFRDPENNLIALMSEVR